MADVEQAIGATLGPGDALHRDHRLVEQKLVAPEPVSGRQRPYRHHAQSGAEVLEERLTAMRRVAAVGLRRLRTA